MYDSYRVFGRQESGGKIRLEAKLSGKRTHPISVGSSVYSDSGVIFEVTYVSGDWIHAVKDASEFGIAASPLRDGSGFDVLRFSGGSTEAQSSTSTSGDLGAVADSATKAAKEAIDTGSSLLKVAALLGGIYLLSQIDFGGDR